MEFAKKNIREEAFQYIVTTKEIENYYGKKNDKEQVYDIFSFSRYFYGVSWSKELQKAIMLDIETIFKSNPNHEHVIRGDVVRIDPDIIDSYNDGIFVFDGENLVDMDKSFYEYGVIDKQFSYPEFPFNYWDRIIYFLEQYIWIDETMLIDILSNNNTTPESIQNDEIQSAIYYDLTTINFTHRVKYCKFLSPNNTEYKLHLVDGFKLEDLEEPYLITKDDSESETDLFIFRADA